MISQRTKAALAAAKACGVTLGGDRGAVLTPRLAKPAARPSRRAPTLAPPFPTYRRPALAAREPSQRS
jgi:hypothetical protein